ncbi:Sec-independent protein translocase subunit TatA [Sphaerisporangium sp. NBC_01403]|uniref:Sec-independent protein translocase subunit TatA n=1 Tax=Sphaerisporangium sp. NBC_01403 TaxID=2903599 RepID=UPI00324908E8
MGSLSPVHWVIVALAFVVLFGAKKLPDTARALGQSLRIFKSETAKMNEENPAGPAQGPAGSSPSAEQITAAPEPSLEEQARLLEERAAALRAQAGTPRDLHN